MRRLDAERFAARTEKLSPRWRARASMAITIEPRVGGQTYQGIVALSPDGIAASAETYFVQSEQLPTVIRLAAAPLLRGGRQDAALARRRHHAAGDAGSQQGARTATRTIGSGCR